MIHKVRYASAQCSTTYGRLGKVFPGVNGEAFKGMMRYIQARFEEEGGRIQDELALDGLPKSIMEVAHAVLPPDDSSLQWSMPGSGLTEDPSATLDSLYERMVMRYEDRVRSEARSDDEVWRKFKRTLEERRVLRHLQPKKISVQDDEVEFQYAWKNGVWHCLEPLSFDLTRPRVSATRCIGG
jgi:Protein of unknown function (DUF3037)